ncbi:hypothetical protein IAI10_16140 [Clostridium sp. 19966]|uniref:hypothetical protein n=1 Tax=Clostridium sp. 19966 TaxID=2768166 RepID=UPI0028DFC06E|nr:hypothetical protein [Clostridium sp. 19966]MDT8718197.1 hypothetical protein [Clostridium sp. 19966]
MISMERFIFNNDGEIVAKLKELGIFTKTKTAKDLKKLKFKKKINNKTVEFNCKIVSYNRKKTNNNCLNEYYENLSIEVENKVFDINIDYFKDIQI